MTDLIRCVWRVLAEHITAAKSWLLTRRSVVRTARHTLTLMLLTASIVAFVIAARVPHDFWLPIFVHVGTALAIFAGLHTFHVAATPTRAAVTTVTSVVLLTTGWAVHDHVYAGELLRTLGIGILLYLAVDHFMARRLEDLERLAAIADETFADEQFQGSYVYMGWSPYGTHYIEPPVDLPFAAALGWEASAFATLRERCIAMRRHDVIVRVTAPRSGRVRLSGARRIYDQPAQKFADRSEPLTAAECRTVLGRDVLREVRTASLGLPFAPGDPDDD